MSGKYALIIANTDYGDPALAQLTAPGKDAEDFARVLRDKEIAAFDEVNVLLNNSEPQVREAIDEFFDQKKRDDLLILYFSGHGVRDEAGSLYLALKNTTRARLRATALKSDFIREAMDQSYSKRIVLILDCCNSGAFAQGTKAIIGGSVGTASAFGGTGFGRIVLTASDSTQFAWEGDKVIGETQNSLFTHFLVKGLEGEADHDYDGRITVDELFDYAYEQIVTRTPNQTPSKHSDKQQGEIVLRQSAHIGNTRPISLPNELIEAMEDVRTFVREGVVGQLEKLTKGKNLGLAHAAREALEKMAEDDSRRVAQLAAQALETARQAEEERLARTKIEMGQKADAESKAKEQAKHLAAQKAEDERIARAKIEAEQKAEEERIVRAKIEAEQKANKEAQRLITQKTAAEALERAKIEVEQKIFKEQEPSVQVSDKIDYQDKATAMSGFQVWMKAITKPSQQTFSEIMASPVAAAGKVYWGIFIASAISYLIILLILYLADTIKNSSSSLSIGWTISFSLFYGIVMVFAFSIGAALTQWMAKLLGGVGTFSELAYASAAIFIPLTLVSTLSWIIILALIYTFASSPISSIVAVFCFFLVLGIGLYWFFLQVIAVKVVNQFSWGKAIGSMLTSFLPIIIFCCVPAIILWFNSGNISQSLGL